jgi:hypothetical protein
MVKWKEYEGKLSMTWFILPIEVPLVSQMTERTRNG